MNSSCDFVLTVCVELMRGSRKFCQKGSNFDNVIDPTLNAGLVEY